MKKQRAPFRREIKTYFYSLRSPEPTQPQYPVEFLEALKGPPIDCGGDLIDRNSVIGRACLWAGWTACLEVVLAQAIAEQAKEAA